MKKWTYYITFGLVSSLVVIDSYALVINNQSDADIEIVISEGEKVTEGENMKGEMMPGTRCIDKYKHRRILEKKREQRGIRVFITLTCVVFDISPQTFLVAKNEKKTVFINPMNYSHIALNAQLQEGQSERFAALKSYTALDKGQFRGLFRPPATLGYYKGTDLMKYGRLFQGQFLYVDNLTDDHEIVITEDYTFKVIDPKNG